MISANTATPKKQSAILSSSRSVFLSSAKWAKTSTIPIVQTLRERTLLRRYGHA
jgi:hypothetical protein